MKEVVRDDVIISTKFTPQTASDSPDAMQEMINGSKARLHTDVMDIYWNRGRSQENIPRQILSRQEQDGEIPITHI
ncbi:hypothetical protein [Faecalicatena orotica]|uniref:hypothetical protein n=1 Tax=Faecalicatena orotica TaxID=1544 RepID=UPI001A9A5477|nr:hypothetical protein [Faecalicatena orotica]